MTFTKNTTPEQRVELIINNAEEIKGSAPAYNVDGNALLNAILETVISREFEFDFLMVGKTSIYDLMEEVAEKIEADGNEDFYVNKTDLMMNEYARAQEYFDAQRKLQMDTYSRKFN